MIYLFIYFYFTFILLKITSYISYNLKSFKLNKITKLSPYTNKQTQIKHHTFVIRKQTLVIKP
jgi:hypothetical protein